MNTTFPCNFQMLEFVSSLVKLNLGPLNRYWQYIILRKIMPNHFECCIDGIAARGQQNDCNISSSFYSDEWPIHVTGWSRKYVYRMHFKNAAFDFYLFVFDQSFERIILVYLHPQMIDTRVNTVNRCDCYQSLQFPI